MRLRALAFLVLFSTQALAAGAAGVVHLCSMTPAMESCRCPHGKKADAPLSWRAVDCCETQTLEAVQPATPDQLRSAAPASPPATLAPFWMVPPKAEALPVQRFAWSVAPPGQGPPLYLMTRALLN